jgi:nucleotide-binding universal stress UspA family protein
MVTVLDTSPGYWAHANLWDKAMGGAKNLVTEKFESFESTAKKAKVSFHSEIIESKSVTKTIVSYSKSKKIDLIVLGAQGITGWDKLVLGSVTDSVAHRVRCPVLIVR